MPLHQGHHLPGRGEESSTMSSSGSKGERTSVSRPDDRPTTVSKRGIIRRREVPRRPVRSTTSTAIAAIASLLAGRPDSVDGTGVYSRVERPRSTFVAVPQQQQPGGAVQALRRGWRGAECCDGSSSSLASTSWSGRGRGTPCSWRWSPPSSSSLSSLSLLPNCNWFLPRREAPAGSLQLSPSRIRRHGGQHTHQRQQQQQRYRHRQTRASWWCSFAMESETASAADTATATQQLLAEGEQEEVGLPPPPRAVPRLQHTGSTTEDTSSSSSIVDGVGCQLGFVGSHGFVPIVTATTTKTPATAVEAKGPLSAIARRRLRQLECSWLEDPGKDVPFEFAEMRQVRLWRYDREAYSSCT